MYFFNTYDTSNYHLMIRCYVIGGGLCSAVYRRSPAIHDGDDPLFIVRDAYDPLCY